MNVEEGVAQVSAEIMDDLLLELQVRSRDHQDGEDLGVVKISEIKRSANSRMRLREGRIFETEDDFRKVGCDGDSGMNSGSCKFLGRSS